MSNNVGNVKSDASSFHILTHGPRSGEQMLRQKPMLVTFKQIYLLKRIAKQEGMNQFSFHLFADYMFFDCDR